MHQPDPDGKFLVKPERPLQHQLLGGDHLHRQCHVAAQPQLHDDACGPQSRDRRQQGRCRARAFEQHVKAALLHCIFAQPFGILSHVDHHIRPGPQRHRQRKRAQIGRDDQIGPGPPCRQYAQHPDWPTARHQHRFAQQRSGLPHGMQTNGQGFGHRRLAGGQPVRRNALRGLGHQHLPKCPLTVRKRHRRAIKPHVQAMVDLCPAAIGAIKAWPRRRHRHQLTDAQPRHSRAQIRDMARHFMSQHHRFAQADRGPDAALMVIMQVRPANPAHGHPDLHLARPRHLDRVILDPQIMGSVDDDGFHKGQPTGSRGAGRSKVTQPRRLCG